jgi:hypothetical protein
MKDTLTYSFMAAMFVIGMYFFYSSLEYRDALFSKINQEQVR